MDGTAAAGASSPDASEAGASVVGVSVTGASAAGVSVTDSSAVTGTSLISSLTSSFISFTSSRARTHAVSKLFKL